MNFSKFRLFIFSSIHLTVFLLSLITNWYWPLVLILAIVLLLEALEKLGKGIVLREMISLFAVFISLIMPYVGYQVYNSNNRLSRLWVRYMPVGEDIYFSYALPALSLFVFALCLPFLSNEVSDSGEKLNEIVERAKRKLITMPFKGSLIILVGLGVFVIIDFLPSGFQFVASLLYFASFAGLLYVYFTPNIKYKKLILAGFGIFIISNALRGGMFTIVAYMGITIFSFFFLGRRVSLWKKLAVFMISAFFLLVIQTVKVTYRKITWDENYQGNKAALFANLVWDRINSPKGFWAADAFFPIYYRTNQGYNLGLVMRRFPSQRQHDYGENLGVTLASSVTPRLLWPDKPEAGGKFNMKYYAGVTLRGWSTNVGPLGEAYGSFGRTGGMIYMLLLGMFIRWAYLRVFMIARRIPLVIFWIPVLFYQITYSAESDTLQILNSLLKSSFFLWMLSYAAPSWLGIVKDKFRGRMPKRNQLAPQPE